MQGEFWSDTGPTSGDGTTCAPSHRPEIGVSTSSVADSHARTSVRRGNMRGSSKDLDRASGSNLRGSLARYDPDSSSWRTWQTCWLSGWEEFSATWPRSGLMRSGRIFRRAPLVPHTFAVGFSWLPTPRRTQAKIPYFRGARDLKGFSSANLEEVLASIFPDLIGKRMNRDYLRWMMGFPIGHLPPQPSATPSSPRSPSGSGDESSNPTGGEP